MDGMNDRQKKALRTNQHKIASNLSDVKTVLDLLLESGDLTPNLVEEIMVEQTHTDKVRALLKIMAKRPDRAFYNLCDALKKSEHQKLAKGLESSYTERGTQEGNIEPGDVETADQAMGGTDHGPASSQESMTNQPTSTSYQLEDDESIQ